MSIEDPYFVVRDEVNAAETACAKKLIRWRALMQSGDCRATVARDLTSELRSNVRSAEWDLEDLEESVKVVENNPARFGINARELESRKSFIRESRLHLADMKTELEAPDVNERLLAMESTPAVKISMPSNRYGGGFDNPAYRDGFQAQSQLLREQDDELELVAGNVKSLKQISQAIGDELDDQAGLLDTLGGEIDSAQGRMNSTLAKIQRVTRLSSDRRQWYAIGGLALLIVILIIILFS